MTVYLVKFTFSVIKILFFFFALCTLNTNRGVSGDMGNIMLFCCEKNNTCNVLFECFSLLNTVKTVLSHSVSLYSHILCILSDVFVFSVKKWQHLNICRLRSTERANVCTWKASWSFFCSIRAICRSGQNRNSKDEQQLMSVCIVYMRTCQRL